MINKNIINDFMDVKAFEWLNKNQLSYDIWNKKYRYEDEDFDGSQ